MAEGVVKTFTCPVDGNPEPKVEWYSEKTGKKISTGKQIKTEENGCYTCVARNSLGSSVSITQCLIVGKPVVLMGLWPYCTDKEPSKNFRALGDNGLMNGAFKYLIFSLNGQEDLLVTGTD